VELDPVLRELLVCPACHGGLRVDDAAERLVCTECGLRYPVRDGIPVMLIDEADPPEADPGAAAGTPAGAGPA